MRASLFAILLLACCPALAVARQATVQGELPQSGTPSSRVYPVDPDRAPRPMMRAVRATRAPVIDGDVSDAEWSGADSVTSPENECPRRNWRIGIMVSPCPTGLMASRAERMDGAMQSPPHDAAACDKAVSVR